jgi:hypothetical protein
MMEVGVDIRLLRLARRILERHRFRVQEGQLEGLEDATWLLAESDYFILGVVAGATLDDLLLLEGYVADALGGLLQEGRLGAKRWDSYVVLLAASGTEDRGRPDVVRLQHNTRSIRRLVALGTAAHEDAVAAALATFLPLPEPPMQGLRAPFDELIEQLVLNGVGEEHARAAVESYRAQGEVDGA